MPLAVGGEHELLTVSSRSRDLAMRMLGIEEVASGSAPDLPEGDCHRALERMWSIFQPIIGASGFETILAGATIQGASMHPAMVRLDIPLAGVPSAEAITGCLNASGHAAKTAISFMDEVVASLGRVVGWDVVMGVLSEEWPEAVGLRGNGFRQAQA